MSCPAESQIVECLHGKLEEPVSRVLFAHLETCPHCQKIADDFDSQSDSFINEIRASSSFVDTSESCCQMIEQAESFTVGEGQDDFLNELGDTPRRIRDYQILEPLGFGGMGEVYRARHIRLKRDVAIKIILARRENQDAAVRFFQQEMEAVGRLEPHPHLVQALDAGEQDGVQYLVMQLVDGLNAEQLLREVEYLSVADVCEIGRQAALGLHYAHQQGLIHRDVKPSNLMVAAGGAVQVMDLGLSMFRSAEGAMKQVLGSVQYMAPEQADRNAEVDVRADIYGLGGTLYFLLTGNPPHQVSSRDRASRRLQRRTRATLTRLREIRKDVPPALRGLIEHMLAPIRDDRPTSAAEVAKQLSRFTTGANLFDLMAEYRGGAECGRAVVAELDETPVGHRLRRRARWPKFKFVLLSLLGFVGLAMSVAVLRTMFPPDRDAVSVGDSSIGFGTGPSETVDRQRMTYQFAVRDAAKQYVFTSSPGYSLTAEVADLEAGSVDDVTNANPLSAWDPLEFKLEYPDVYAVYEKNWLANEAFFHELFPLPAAKLPENVTFLRYAEIGERSFRIQVRESHRSICLIKSDAGRIRVSISFAGGRRDSEFANLNEMKTQSGELAEIYLRYRPAKFESW